MLKLDFNTDVPPPVTPIVINIIFVDFVHLSCRLPGGRVLQYLGFSCSTCVPALCDEVHITAYLLIPFNKAKTSETV